jgi:hypothetical protein
MKQGLMRSPVYPPSPPCSYARPLPQPSIPPKKSGKPMTDLLHLSAPGADSGSGSSSSWDDASSAQGINIGTKQPGLTPAAPSKAVLCERILEELQSSPRASHELLNDNTTGFTPVSDQAGCSNQVWGGHSQGTKLKGQGRRAMRTARRKAADDNEKLMTS